MAEQRLTVATMAEMEKIIKRVNEALDTASGKARIPDFIWKRCKGVAIINVSEIGFVFSMSTGDGVVIQHKEDGTWGPPSAIKFSGGAAGAIFGKGTKHIFLFPMTFLGFQMLTGQTSFELGVQMGVAVGPYGREAEVGANLGGAGADITYSYVFEEGAILDIGVNAYMISAENKVNGDFYNTHKSAMDVIMLEGAVDIPQGKGVEELHEKLAQLSKK
jgi:lipid-binding SYLF domain-containing protein